MYIKIIIKTVTLYAFIVLVYKIMGKKEVGKLGIIDLIVSILIAELAAISIENIDSSILSSIIPISVLVIIELLLGYISMKNSKVRKLLDGEPEVIINKGKLNFNIMSKLRYTLDDLVAHLRDKGIKSIDEIDYAVLENNGKLSIFQNTNEYPMPIIVDGEIDFKVLRDMNKDIKWINKILKKNSIELEDVFYAFYKKDKTYIIKKSELF